MPCHALAAAAASLAATSIHRQAPARCPRSLQVVLTTIEPRGRPELRFDAYEYTVQSHKYTVSECRLWAGFARARVQHAGAG